MFLCATSFLFIFVVALTEADPQCPNVAPPSFMHDLSQYFTKSGLRVNVVHISRSNADEQELYDSACLEATLQKRNNNQYILNFNYRGYGGFINVSLYENENIPDNEARLVQVIPSENLLGAVQCNPQERIHIILGFVKNYVGSSCPTALYSLLNRTHLDAGFAPINETETELTESIARCCKRH